MNYAKWKVHFDPGAIEGLTPEMEIEARGGFIEGVVALSQFEYLGYISDATDLTGLEKYEITLLTAEEALTLAQSINADFSFDENGKFDWPRINFIKDELHQ